MTSRKKYSALTWSSVAFAAVLVPTFAAAQDAGEDRGVGVRERVKPEYEPLGIRAGAFVIRPEITGEVEYNDNIYATQTNEQEDWIYRIVPSVDVRSDWSRNELGLTANLVDSEYSDFSDESHTDWGTLANGRIDLGVRSSLRATAGYRVDHEPRTDGAAPTTATELVEIKTQTFSVGGAHEFNRLRVSGDVTYNDRDYGDVTDPTALGGVRDQDVRDYNQTEYAGRADYALPKGGVIFVEAAYNEVKYDQLTPTAGLPINQDSTGYRALVGTRIDVTNLLRGEAAVGFMSQEYDDSRLSSVDGLAAKVDMQYFVTGITTIGFGGTRSVQESGVFGGAGAQGGGVVASSVYARLDHELQRNIVLSGDVAYRDYDYKEFDRTDNYIEAGLGAEYLANRVLSFGLNYRYIDRTSDGVAATNEFTINRFILSATARF